MDDPPRRPPAQRGPLDHPPPASAHLPLAGVSGYEGVAAGSGGPQGLAAVDAFCGRLRGLAVRLVAERLIQPTPERPLILGIGGSAYFDHVAAVLAANLSDDVAERVAWRNAAELFRLDLPGV